MDGVHECAKKTRRRQAFDPWRPTVNMLTTYSGTIVVPGGCNADGRLDGASRARARTALFADLPFGPDHTALKVAYATQVEACAADMSKNDYATYIVTMARVRYNIASNGRRIIEAYPVTRLCKLSHKHLHEETAHAQRDEAVLSRVRALLKSAAKEADRASATASSIAVEIAIRCPKCKTQDRIARSSMQRTRGDEGMKTKCMCLCGHSWELAS